ncbi:hypothetical protein HaLaN_12105 [Haematococcus lacustris]|uniref:Uncharacterized protein n=1 Tax=Haematococcus lacustris TaxID=44745 RepID=A0A699ZAD1_HAELA|nr:hypothetical protein HaLaN_12105 [Haematococcus lacustris]
MVADQLAQWKLTKGQAYLKHITVTLATWDAVWEVYLDPKWARQRPRLYGAQKQALMQFLKNLEDEMAEVAMKRYDGVKQLVVYFGSAAPMQPGNHSGSSLRTRAQHSSTSQAQQAHQG